MPRTIRWCKRGWVCDSMNNIIPNDHRCIVVLKPIYCDTIWSSLKGEGNTDMKIPITSVLSIIVRLSWKFKNQVLVQQLVVLSRWVKSLKDRFYVQCRFEKIITVSMMIMQIWSCAHVELQCDKCLNRHSHSTD